MTSPGELLRRWRKYCGRYGAAHASVRFMGTRIPFVWKLFGPFVSRSYRIAWINSAAPKIVNLGGGGNCLDGCLTVDTDPRADSYVDLRKPLPFGDKLIDGIFCEEVIEHLSELDGAVMLRECLRIMKPGAVIRITTPDLNWFSLSLIDGEIDCGDMNKIFYGHKHRYLYSRNKLSDSVRRCGFIELRQSIYRDSNSQLGHLDSHPDRFNHTPDMSQYLEARRPDDIDEK
jgi:predicted SAM-dependent methyltransferase